MDSVIILTPEKLHQ